MDAAIRLSVPVEKIRYLPLVDDHLDHHLQHYCMRVYCALRGTAEEVRPLITARAQQGLALLEQMSRDSGDDPAAAEAPALETFTPHHLLPWLPLAAGEQTDRPMSWLTIASVPPYHDPERTEISPLRRQVFCLIALINCAHLLLLRFQARFPRGEPLAADLASPPTSWRRPWMTSS